MEQQAEKYLLALLREDTNKILTLIERIASEQKSKEVFCKEILKIAAEKKFTQWIIDYSDNWQTIKKYCEGNMIMQTLNG